MYTKISEAAKYIQEKISLTPSIGLILGSGLGSLADEIEMKTVIPYSEIPHFPQSTVKGHKGQLVIGELEGKKVIAMQGRFHYYEGYSMQQVTFPVRVMKELGISSLIVTNAAGGVNKDFQPGDFMIITDHINLMGDNPLIGKNDDRLGDRFPDMSECYDQQLIQHAEECANRVQIKVKKGVYAANTGPQYETKAEVKMVHVLGGDAVGMSTVPEVIAANHGGIRVLGISCISNMAAGILEEPLSHAEVIETTERVKEDFVKLVRIILADFPDV
ncbi:purine nucleoside phosphorylase [Compostibacillus humi]|uniref:Purine nucleoside phosphorylase n=1 Tax=Compostibacillus humi TaxID=1245525 RepID=A0A8J2ZQI8_9BACI|nr:purine-nucleoside phosphorylase [Compostibacillus humi]GGH69094.1 purine nucleoside phosphorylase [Compostibacillus humi]HLT54734.1 purine-nucleoside phosphorylase [Bacillota bacterium]